MNDKHEKKNIGNRTKEEVKHKETQVRMSKKRENEESK